MGAIFAASFSAPESDHAPDLERLRAGRAQFLQPRRGSRFRKLLAGFVENKLVMVIGRLRQTEQHLQQSVDAGRPEQILPAHDIGDALQGVIDDGGQMVALRG